MPRSTAAGWLRAAKLEIVTLDVVDKTESQLRADILKLRHRIRVLGAVVRLLLQLLRMSGFSLEAKRIAPSPARTALLHAVEHARELPPLRAVLRLAGVSSFRGQTPDEMYSGTVEQFPVELASAKSAAPEARLHANRSLSCENCARLPAGADGDLSAAA